MSATFNVPAFYAALDKHRWEIAAERQRTYPWREVADELDFAHSLFVEMRKYGKAPGTAILVRLMAWLGETDLKPYITEEDRCPSASS